MRLALVICEYFPWGGVQRDFRHVLDALAVRGHECRVYCVKWQGAVPDDIELRRTPAKGFGEHRRRQYFVEGVLDDLAADPVDCVVGFDPMPGLDICYVAEPCGDDPAAGLLSVPWGRKKLDEVLESSRRGIFAATGGAHILIPEGLADGYQDRYGIPGERLHSLPPGTSPDRFRPENARTRRRSARGSLNLEEEHFVTLLLANDYRTGGLDRALHTVARIREEQPSIEPRLLVAGSGRQRRYRRLARKLGVADCVQFLGSTEKVPDLLLAADVLLHPVREHGLGRVLLEAVVAGLPVVSVEGSTYLSCVRESRGGICLPAPFDQDLWDRAVMRMLDGVYRADCRESALLYTRLTDLNSHYVRCADLIEQVAAGEVKAL